MYQSISSMEHLFFSFPSNFFIYQLILSVSRPDWAGAVQVLTSEILNLFCRILKISRSVLCQGVLYSSFNYKFITWWQSEI